MNDEKKFLYDVLISTQWALLGLTPNFLRAIIVKCSGFKADLVFYCDGELSEQDKEFITIDICGEFSDGIDSTVMGSFGKDVFYKFFDWKHHIIRLDYPTALPKDGYLAYKRYESGKFDHNDYLFPEHFKEDLTEEWGSNLRPLILISSQKALLNRVEENLRKVLFAWDDKNIWLYFYYDNAITDFNHSLAQAAADEFMQSFPDHKLEFKILLSDELDKLSSEHDWSAAFSRGKIG
jgi:hypothetical protein